jgi:DNA repair exonuclease SbcCD ATPase subunit
MSFVGRMLGMGSKKTARAEPAEFLTNFDRIVEVHKKVKDIRKLAKKWMEHTHALGKIASKLARETEANGGRQNELDALVDTHKQDLKTLQALTRRQTLLYAIIKKRHDLEQKRISRESYRKKLAEATRKDPDGAHKKLTNKLATYTNLYDSLYKELVDAMTFAVTMVDDHGPCALISDELGMFRRTQIEKLDNLQIAAGLHEATPIEQTEASHHEKRVTLDKQVISMVEDDRKANDAAGVDSKQHILKPEPRVSIASARSYRSSKGSRRGSKMTGTGGGDGEVDNNPFAYDSGDESDHDDYLFQFKYN